MAFIVEMAHGTPDSPEFRVFSCGKATWEGLLSLGKTFGWVPRGAAPDQKAVAESPEYMKFFHPNYEPDEWAYCKMFTAEDASELADALQRAAEALRAGNVALLEKKGTFLLRDDMTPEELYAANALPSQALNDFIRFLKHGEFVFAWDD